MRNGREHMHRENASHASADESNRLEHTSINDDPAQENAVEVAESIAESTEEADGLRPGSKLRALSKRQRAIVTVTFFSMFFGAGNLIFPPLLGAQAGNRTFIAMLGFIISAVGLPILGVLVVAQAGGFGNLAARVSKRFSLVLGVAIILTIGPLFAIPRTASTSFEMAFAPFTTDASKPWVQLAYSLVFFVAALIIAQHPDKLTRVLGKVMGPLLLALIVILFVVCLFLHHPPFADPSGSYAHSQLIQGMIDGYQTMDLLAALYFGIVISANIREMGVTDERDNRRETGIGGAFTGVMLVLVYAALSFIGAVSGAYQPAGPNDTGATVLTNLSDRVFGHVGTVFIGVIFVVACFNVCIGLISTCSSYFHNHFPTVFGKRVGYTAWSILFTIVSLLIANIGLSSIIALAVPVLEALYPIAIVLVVLSLVHKPFSSHFRYVYFTTIVFTAVASIANGLVKLVEVLHGHIDWLKTACNWLPMNANGLGWLVPALVGLIVGVIVSLAVPQAKSADKQ